MNFLNCPRSELCGAAALKSFRVSSKKHMLIDDVTVKLSGGKGGNGAVSFTNVMMSRGPTGADGGRGGSVSFEAISNLDALQQFRYTKEVAAGNGDQGQKSNRDGASGKDVILKIPVGTVITNITKGETVEFTHIGETLLAVKGGRGGRGNYKFRHAENITPKEHEDGFPGEEAEFRLELKLIADVGLVGFPNAGKSSLLNTLTKAQSKVGNYPFTTLEPSLGVYYDIVLADIPGLIEGAANGKGLGTKFLRHIERTGTLFHLISLESEDVASDYRVIRKELEQYSENLGSKKEYVFLTKSDNVTPEVIAEKVAMLKKIGVEAQPISIIDQSEWQPVIRALTQVAADKHLLE